jgi:hypothetical protein
MPTPVLARKMWRTLEPYHGMIYFSPHAAAAYAALGVPPAAGYFASRAAAFGPAPAEVVIATFYNFHPAVVRAAIPSAWQHASPERILAARLQAADETLREVLGEEVLVGADMAEAAELAMAAAQACDPPGRPLYAAHASLDWPEPPHLALWHAITLLREYRGDGHLAALVLAGIDGCESLVTHGAAGDNLIPLALLKATRAWPDDEWDAARQRLVARGWLDDGDRLTEAGDAVRRAVEDRTYEAALAPWVALGEDACGRLRSLVRPWSKAISGSGIFAGPPTSP